jgi:sec-independent protein translocase protein TatB
MFDIGWSEMMVIAILALIVIGPKDLPRVLKSVSYWVRKARSLAREFQTGVDEMIREADLDDAKTLLQGGSLGVEQLVEETIDPKGSLKEEARDLERAANAPAPETSQMSKPSSSEEPGSSEKAESSEKAAGSTEAAEAEVEPPKATIIKHPVQVAPPHSLTPPPKADDNVPAAEAPEDDTQKTA